MEGRTMNAAEYAKYSTGRGRIKDVDEFIAADREGRTMAKTRLVKW